MVQVVNSSECSCFHLVVSQLYSRWLRWLLRHVGNPGDDGNSRNGCRGGVILDGIILDGVVFSGCFEHVVSRVLERWVTLVGGIDGSFLLDGSVKGVVWRWEDGICHLRDVGVRGIRHHGFGSGEAQGRNAKDWRFPRAKDGL